MDKLEFKITDDGKGKSQSVSARVVVDDDYDYFTGIEGYGETEEEAIEDLKNKIVPLCKQVVNLFKKETEHACDTCGNGHYMDRDIFKTIPKNFCPGYCEKLPH